MVDASSISLDSSPSDTDTFLGKMRLFFPSFFLNLSLAKLDYLKANEKWVLDIFGDLWRILLNNIENSENLCPLRTTRTKLHSPVVLHSPPFDAPLDIVPLSISESGRNPVFSAHPSLTPTTPVEPQPKMLVHCSPLVDPSILTCSNPKSFDSLEPKPLPVSNMSSLLPSATLD
jgi:hypothetical protein